MSDPIQLSEDETFVLNVGPQHPATHGVLRVKLRMDGEYIVDSETVIGHIHRMHEKMGELKTYNQFLMNLSRVAPPRGDRSIGFRSNDLGQLSGELYIESLRGLVNSRG